MILRPKCQSHMPTWPALLLGCLIFVVGCDASVASAVSTPADSAAPADSSSASDASRLPVSGCVPRLGVSGTPSTIEDVIDLAHVLFGASDGELTLPCLVESLDRPLGTLAVDSLFSAQPAAGRNNPRIFLFTRALVMSVVPAGEGRNVIELSQLTSPTRGIKAEIPFPLHAPIPATLPFDRIRYGSGTYCGGCHAGEVPASQISTAEAFESDILRPRPAEEVPLSAVAAQAASCDRQQDARRCDLLTAVFGHGEIYRQEFSPLTHSIYGD